MKEGVRTICHTRKRYSSRLKQHQFLRFHHGIGLKRCPNKNPTPMGFEVTYAYDLANPTMQYKTRHYRVPPIIVEQNTSTIGPEQFPQDRWFCISPIFTLAEYLPYGTYWLYQQFSLLISFKTASKRFEISLLGETFKRFCRLLLLSPNDACNSSLLSVTSLS